jgi:Ca2+-binding RTX toxin-like protein
MINRDYFAHNTPEGLTPQQRTDAAGYLGAVGENIVNRGVSPGPINPTTAIIQEHRDLFVDLGVAGRGHRLNILDARYKEAGIGQAVGDFQGFSTSMVTQDFGIPDPTHRFVTGVAFNDTVVADKFYTVGEARAGVKVNNGPLTGAAGDYALAISTVAQNITFAAGGLPNTITVAINAGTDNVKLDVVNGNSIFSSTSVTSVSGARAITLLGIGNINAVGAAAGEVLTGNRGINTISGNGGADTLRGGPNRDTLTGGADPDTFAYNAVSESGVTAATRDTITDFVHLIDTLDVSKIDASTILPDNNAFTLIGSQSFSTTSEGQLRSQKFNSPGTDNDFTMVFGDTDADTDAEFTIKLKGIITLTPEDITP